MSARKKVNQSRPRALARAAASRVAGVVCFDAADDPKPSPTRRSSRPPSNSSANADSSMSPAPSGIYGVGFWPSAPCNRPPLMFRAAPGYARQRAATIRRNQSPFQLGSIIKGQADPEAASITLAGVFTMSKRHALSGAVPGRFLM